MSTRAAADKVGSEVALEVLVLDLQAVQGLLVDQEDLEDLVAWGEVEHKAQAKTAARCKVADSKTKTETIKEEAVASVDLEASRATKRKKNMEKMSLLQEELFHQMDDKAEATEEVDHRAAETVAALASKVTAASKRTKKLNTEMTMLAAMVEAAHTLRTTTTTEPQLREREARKKKQQA